MKLIGLVDASAKDSEDYLLLEFISKEFDDLFDLELLEVSAELSAADGFIILSSETDQAVSSSLQSLIEYSSKERSPLENKAVLVMSKSEYNQESSESQLQLRQVLEEPAVGAYTFPGNQFFLGKIMEALSEGSRITDQEVINHLRESFMKYMRFVDLIGEFEKTEAVKIEAEDLYATGSIETTIDGLDKDADDWLEQATEKVNAVDGNTYVRLDRGVLTVDQLNYFLNSMPMELTFMDSNNQFLYYNYNTPAEDMLASTYPNQVGSPIAELHPEGGHQRVEMLIQQLRSGKMDKFKIHVPTHGPNKYVVHNYKAIRDKLGNYLGVNEYVLDLKPTIDWYLKQTNQELVGGVVDAVSSATKNHSEEKTDGISSASVNN